MAPVTCRNRNKRNTVSWSIDASPALEPIYTPRARGLSDTRRLRRWT